MFRTYFLRFVLVTALASALIGSAYSYAAHGRLVLGGVFGAAFGVIFPALEFLLQGEKGARLRRSPFLVFFGVRAGIYVAVILAIEVLGAWLMIGPEAVRDLSLSDFAFSLAASVVGNLFFAIASLLGPGVLFAFAAGRYHRPRSEERALLFIDLRGSTAKAERLGQERFLAFLDAFIVDVTYDIVGQGGEIHKYVGDEVIATWRLKPGLNDAAIVRACMAARDRLAARREAYEGKFGESADFRAALHAGVVAVGEIGAFKKEIALIGDPMNTAARILDACRELGFATLASSALMARLDGAPDEVERKRIAPLPLRGKAAPLDLVALAPKRAADRPTAKV